MVIFIEDKGVVGAAYARYINMLARAWYTLIDETYEWRLRCCTWVFLRDWEADTVMCLLPCVMGNFVSCHLWSMLDMKKEMRRKCKMGLIELFLVAVGLSMDAFAVSVCKGLAMKRVSVKNVLVCGVWFGGFQALMPMIGYILGAQFEVYINAIAPWIAFVLLAVIGGNMIWESFKEEEEANAGLDIKTMFLMAVATSIDAMAVGITFACVPVTIISAGRFLNTFLGAVLIGLTTFILSCIGVKVGNGFGARYRARSVRVGGVILVLIGLKILLEHLNIF